MIRGYFSTDRTIRRPFVRCELEFPDHPDIRPARVELLVDTGADRTMLSPVMADRIGLNLDSLGTGRRSTGIGGSVLTRVVECQFTIQDFTTQLGLQIPEIRMPVPAILGRDIMADFALFMEERTRRVLLLNQNDLEGMGFASLF